VKFLTRSVLILLALYGLVFAIGDLYLARIGIPVWGAIAFAVALVGFQYLAGPWFIEMVISIHWDDLYPALPARNREFIAKLCAERGLKIPRIGVIASGTPNAFSFGHTPRDSRVVVTQGLLDVLTVEEANAVLAHEIGHIEHWDFVVMTFAALVPLLLYQLYAFTRHVNNLRALAYGAYLCYLISQFIVLLLNRTREYFADHYAAEVTRTPQALSSALIKIAYGMVKADGGYKEAMRRKEVDVQMRREYRIAGSMAVMGISNLHSGAALALAGADPSSAVAVMRWDLINPWARLYQLNSTHPLTALRVRALNEQADDAHQTVQYPLPTDQPIHWGTFPVEFLVWAVPLLSIAILLWGWWLREWLAKVGIALPAKTVPILLIVSGLGWLLRVAYRYRGTVENASVLSLLEDTEVSQMRPRAVRLHGEILGRGVPGVFWSPDLVLRDSTGIVFLLYRQTLPLARFLFAIAEADSLIGQTVDIEGWFRRGLTPYVEMSRLRGEDGSVHRTYSRWVQSALAIAAAVVGWLWLN
jgi:Zn-dependent protease with chaperone function